MAGAFLGDSLMSYNLNSFISGDKCTTYSKCNECSIDNLCGICKSDNNVYCISGNSSIPFYSNDTSVCSVNYDYTICPSNFGWPILILLILFIASFSSGMGSMPWAINSEIFPLEYRSEGMAITSSVNWLTNFAVSSTFLSLVSGLKKHGAFFLYAGISLINWIFLYINLVETKGLSLEEIQDLFKSKSPSSYTLINENK